MNQLRASTDEDGLCDYPLAPFLGISACPIGDGYRVGKVFTTLCREGNRYDTTTDA